jgi:hypothetical protein
MMTRFQIPRIPWETSEVSKPIVVTRNGAKIARFDNIQDAHDFAEDSDTITLMRGIYQHRPLTKAKKIRQKLFRWFKLS